MYVEFEKLAADSRIWIYQADRAFRNEELPLIEQILKDFTASWDSHGQPMAASYSLMYQRFVVLVADEKANIPGGCSIDKSVHCMQALGQRLGIDFFNRTNVWHWTEKDIELIRRNELKDRVKNGQLSQQSLVFDNLIERKEQLASEWKKPAQSTWLRGYFQ
jgi:hypothetical protein